MSCTHRAALSLAASLLLYGATAKAQELKLPEPPEEKQSWEPTGELAELLEKMDEATKASCEVFEPLSAEQMSWSPPNGTHTPRWNAEHMAATQLMFFSQVYAELDPEHHKVLRINPAQNPPDYKAAHPEWTGAQEAEQMKKIGEYASGFAYLLEGKDLDARIGETRWTPRAICELVVRHYGEHTANVKKKFELAEWPKE